MRQHLQILVDNKPGVLARVVVQLARRGINIDRLSSRNIERGKRTVIGIGFDADEYTTDRLGKGIARLIDVIEVREWAGESSRGLKSAGRTQCSVNVLGPPESWWNASVDGGPSQGAPSIEQSDARQKPD